MDVDDLVQGNLNLMAISQFVDCNVSYASMITCECTCVYSTHLPDHIQPRTSCAHNTISSTCIQAV